MGIIQILLQKEVITFKNSYLRTRKQSLITLILLTLGLLVIGRVTWALVGWVRPLFSALPPSQAMLLTAPSLYLTFLWFVFSVFSLMLQEARLKFYLSPELTLLISTPIPAGILFIFRFILITCFSVPALATLVIFVLPSLVAVGILSAAPWYYHLFILPVAHLLLTISSSLAVFLVMLLVKVLPAKRIMQGGVVLSLLSTALWMAFFILGPARVLPQLLNWVRAAEPVLSILFPITDAATTLTHLIQGELVIALGPLLRLFLTSGVILVGSMWGAQKLYYAGYDKSQTAEVIGRKPVEPAAKEKLPIFLGRRSYLILTEWKKAVRNYEMAQGTVAFIVMLFVYSFTAGGFVPPEPWKSLILIGHIATVSFLAGGAVAILFIAMPLPQDIKSLMEQRYWLFKVAPLRGGEFLWSYWLALLLPQLLLGGLILLLINNIMGNNILTILLSLIVLALLMGSFGALKLGMDMLGYGGQGEVTTAIGGIIRKSLPFIYFMVAPGILALGQIYTQIRFLSFMHHWPQGLVLAICSALFLTLVGFTLYYSFHLADKYWEEMEI